MKTQFKFFQHRKACVLPPGLIPMHVEAKLKSRLNRLQVLTVCAAVLTAIGSSFSVSAAIVTFSDANWSSMGFPGVNDRVHAAAVDESGNLYIGGSFTIVGDVVANHIAKWDGNRWSAL